MYRERAALRAKRPIEVAMRFDTVWLDARLATLAPGRRGLGIVEHGAVAAKDGRIAFAGPAAELPTGWDAIARVGLAGRWVTPGLIDCHTHLVYAGDRAHEFELRLAGASYEESRGRAAASSRPCGRRGRRARMTSLPQPAAPRASVGRGRHHDRDQVGLRPRPRHRDAHAARRAATAREREVDVVTSFLGAHALPPEADGDKERYIDQVCALIPALAHEQLADAVDAFCEGIAFSSEQTARVFAAAKAAGLPVKLHADQLSNLHGASLAAEHGAVGRSSRIHHEDGVAAMARAGTVACCCRGVPLRKAGAPGRALRRHRVPIAVATDSNPGTSPITSLLMTIAWRRPSDSRSTGHRRRHPRAARALGGFPTSARSEPGKWCDLAIWDIERPADLVYRIGFNPLHARVRRGR